MVRAATTMWWHTRANSAHRCLAHGFLPGKELPPRNELRQQVIHNATCLPVQALPAPQRYNITQIRPCHNLVCNVMPVVHSHACSHEQCSTNNSLDIGSFFMWTQRISGGAVCRLLCPSGWGTTKCVCNMRLARPSAGLTWWDARPQSLHRARAGLWQRHHRCPLSSPRLLHPHRETHSVSPTKGAVGFS